MLSDLYLPADTDPANPNPPEQSEDEDACSETDIHQENADGNETTEGEVSADVKSLMLAHGIYNICLLHFLFKSHSVDNENLLTYTNRDILEANSRVPWVQSFT